MGVAVGIDLGTTNSCVAIVQGDQAKIVESVYGDRIHPSVICFHPSGDVLAGPRAKDRLAIDPENTIYSFKRLLGQDIKAPEIQKLVSHLPYNVVERNGIPVLQTRNKEATLPEVSALMLRYLREMCEETFGVPINEAIITVPANFTDVQRASTKIAGRIAGFNVLRILNEPTAAALAYGFGGEREERIAVYDFGGGTFDITIIELLDDIFEVLSTAGDNFLGGDDFDEKIIYDMVNQFKKQFGFGIEDNPVAMQRIRSVAERAKCQLSSIPEVNATLRELVTGRGGKKIDFSFTVTRDRFEQLGGSLVERTLATCEEALELAKLKPSDLDNVVLVGGSTRIPLVRRQVEEFFGRTPRTQINPDEVVAIGAAINAFSLTQEALSPDIKPRKRANVKVDPFASSPPEAKAPASSTEAPDPFSSQRSPLADIQDPFADKKGSISSKPPRTIGKIELSQKRTMIGIGAARAAGQSESARLQSNRSRQTVAGVPGSERSRENIDLPGLPLDAEQRSDRHPPSRNAEADNELDLWGSTGVQKGKTGGNDTTAIHGQKRPSMADDPDLPIPVSEMADSSRTIPLASDPDLPVPVGTDDGMDLPVPVDVDTENLDLPTIREDSDLPVPVGDVDLPAALRSDQIDLPTTVGGADLPAVVGEAGLPAAPGETDLPITVGTVDLPGRREKADLPGRRETKETQPAVSPIIVAPIKNKPRANPTTPFVTSAARIGIGSTSAEWNGDTDALDDIDLDEIGAEEEISAAPPIAAPPFIPTDRSTPGHTPMQGTRPARPQTGAQKSFESQNAQPPFSRTSIPPTIEPEISEEMTSPPKMPSYHPYHPLDEVVGDDGREAETRTHGEFTVPITRATPAVLLDVSPRGLGIATAGGYCDIIIERNAAIPIEQSRHFATSRDNQTEVFIDVYQGESRRTEENTQLGRIELTNLRAAPRGEISIMVTFEVDTDGILNVRALNEETRETQSTQIKLSGGLADDQVQALVEKYSANAK
jgi:molecular chaperone DnaK (HSP70)